GGGAGGAGRRAWVRARAALYRRRSGARGALPRADPGRRDRRGARLHLLRAARAVPATVHGRTSIGFARPLVTSLRGTSRGFGRMLVSCYKLPSEPRSRTIASASGSPPG